MLVATVGGCRGYNAKELNSNIVLQFACNLQNVALELLNFIVLTVRAISQN
jgi:hypothetical protein